MAVCTIAHYHYDCTKSNLAEMSQAPGSQNGFDNSGKKGPIDWMEGDSVKHTRLALSKIRDEYAYHPAVSSIELLNEPFGPTLDRASIEQFYADGWGDLSGSDVAVTVHDAFNGVTSWNDFGTNRASLVLDTHHYEVFENGQLGQSPTSHISSACWFGTQMASTNKVTIAGEWTGAQTDCAKWLNGVGAGARYHGSYPGSSYIGACAGKDVGTVEALSDADKSNIRHFMEAQLDAYEKADGWIFWTWKTESAPEWSMRDLMKQGLFPKPLWDRQQPGQCGY